MKLQNFMKLQEVSLKFYVKFQIVKLPSPSLHGLRLGVIIIILIADGA